MSPRQKRKPKMTRIPVYEMPLRDCYGHAWPSERVIAIDPDQSPKEYLDTLIHELYHVADPDASEEKVIKVANMLAENLWRHKFRRVHV